MAKHRKRRVPQLKYTDNRGIGWYASYRDPLSGVPRRQRFGRMAEAQARVLYHRWLADHLDDQAEPKIERGQTSPRDGKQAEPSKLAATKVVPGSLLQIASTWLAYQKSRMRQPDEPRTRGTITAGGYAERTRHAHAFLEYLNTRHGSGAVGRMKLADLQMVDVEAYNRALADAGYSASEINKRMQVVKHLIDQAGRSEHEGQVLDWNWDSRRTCHGKPAVARQLPTKDQLQRMLAACGIRERALIWMAIGLGFGQSDLASVRVGCIDQEYYDLRRVKTGLERYGQTPPLVWTLIQSYQQQCRRPHGELLFVTRRGEPLVRGKADAVRQWWDQLRRRIGESGKTLSGFYVLRHLGATEFGGNVRFVSLF